MNKFIFDICLNWNLDCGMTNSKRISFESILVAISYKLLLYIYSLCIINFTQWFIVCHHPSHMALSQQMSNQKTNSRPISHFLRNEGAKFDVTILMPNRVLTFDPNNQSYFTVIAYCLMRRLHLYFWVCTLHGAIRFWVTSITIWW